MPARASTSSPKRAVAALLGAAFIAATAGILYAAVRPAAVRERAAVATAETARLWSAYTDWEPTLAVDPASRDVYQLTTRYNGPRACVGCAKPFIIFRRSRDGGATWLPDQYLYASHISEYDPQIRVSNDGTVYAAFLQGFQPGVTFVKSTDRGATWSAPIVFTRTASVLSWNDRPALAISPSGRDVYLAFNHSDSWIVASHDYGRTFAAPQKTNNDRRYYFHSAGTVAPNGAVYFTAQDYSQNYRGPVNIDVIRSTDGGRSWSTVRVDRSQEVPGCKGVPGCYYGFLGPDGGLAADAAGKLVLAYNANDAPHAAQQIWVRTSDDAAHWSARERLSAADPAANNGYPWVAAGARPGDVRVVWMGTSRDGLWNVWYRRRDGNAWSAPLRFSNARGGAPYQHPGGFEFPYGDYLGAAVDAGGTLHAVWGEGPNRKNPGGSWYTRAQ